MIGALALAAALLISAMAASAGSSAPDRQAATKLVVWLQNDAESGWKDVVTSTNDAFRARHGDVEVDVQYQTWPDHLQKFDATLAGVCKIEESDWLTAQHPPHTHAFVFLIEFGREPKPGEPGAEWIRGTNALRTDVRCAEVAVDHFKTCHFKSPVIVPRTGCSGLSRVAV
jgi:hypothetical protein